MIGCVFLDNISESQNLKHQSLDFRHLKHFNVSFFLWKSGTDFFVPGCVFLKLLSLLYFGVFFVFPAK